MSEIEKKKYFAAPLELLAAIERGIRVRSLPRDSQFTRRLRRLTARLVARDEDKNNSISQYAPLSRRRIMPLVFRDTNASARDRTNYYDYSYVG